jgi:hypothetical protein
MLKFDDQFPIHRKVHGLTDAAFRLHVEAIFWCARNLTDGFIAQADLASVSRYRRPEGYVTELVDRGAWDVAVGGWRIHDFLVWQDSRDKVLRVREQRRKAGSTGGLRSGESRRSKPTAKPKQVGSVSVEPRAPRPPSGGSVGAREAPPRCAGFVLDDDGWCKRCRLPKSNKIHIRSSKQAASPLLDGAA